MVNFFLGHVKKERRKDRKIVYFLNTAYENEYKFTKPAVSKRTDK
jgi:hypothetical protein